VQEQEKIKKNIDGKRTAASWLRCVLTKPSSADRNIGSMDELARDQLSKGHLIERGCTGAFPFANRS
jgi:hypothetical protein